MPRVISRRNVFVRGTLDATGQFTHNINVGFHVHDMIVAQWSCSASTIGFNNPFIVSMVGVGDILIASEQDYDTGSCIFSLNRPVSGIHAFTVREVDGSIVDRTASVLMFCLTFLEFAPE